MGSLHSVRGLAGRDTGGYHGEAMIHELSPDAFATARPLFDELGKLQVSVGAVLDRECDGRLIVDDPRRPRSAFLTTPEGAFLAGDPDNARFNGALRRFVWDELFGRSGWEMLFATMGDLGWDDRFTAMAAPRDVLRVERRHFTCQAPRLLDSAATRSGRVRCTAH